MSNFQKLNLLQKLLNRGDRVEVVAGVLVIEAASGKEVPPKYLADHREQLIREILEIAGRDGWIYTGYTTGNYPVGNGKLKPGVTLQFASLSTGELPWCVFNVILTRARTTTTGKAGGALPKGHFRVNPTFSFCAFWKSTGLKLPKLSAFHDCMGKLKGLIFSFEVEPGTSKIQDKQISLVNVTTEELLKKLHPGIETAAITPDKHLTTTRQASDNYPTRIPDKESSLAQSTQGFKSFSSTGTNKCDTSKQGNAYTRGNVIPLSSSSKRVQDQTTDEWLSHLDS